MPTRSLLTAVNTTHALIDDLYSADLEVATILGLRNLSAFVGELFAAALGKASQACFRPTRTRTAIPTCC